MRKLPRFGLGRRYFIEVMAKSAGLSIFMPAAAALARSEHKLRKPITVGEVIAQFLQETPGAPFGKTVDTLKSGSSAQEVTGIVTTMFATIEVIRKAIALKANFIIAHEPTFYNHLDDTAWLENDEVYRYKFNLLKDNNIAVWRCHDYLHTHRPDGVRAGVLKALDWEKYAVAASPEIIALPEIGLKELVDHVKNKLGIPTLRYIGNLSQTCRRILLMPGASGGSSQIAALGKFMPDLLICGELSEWETAEYIRDARLKGNEVSLIILGHAASEEPGLEWMATWLQTKLPGLKTVHVPSNNPLSFI